MHRIITAFLITLGLAFLSLNCASLKPSAPYTITEEIPSPPREFRAAWVATVANIDWPSEPGLSTTDQKAECIAILDKAQSINLNAIVLQVRAQCDAFYPSDIEPWSYFLTGEQGKAPNPYYDPLEFWIEEAHNRGLELHVWFNPYRAHHPMSGEVTAASVVRTHPEIVKELKDGYYWLDPALKGTQDYSLDVIMDVVRRYDVDGVHLDDYFYPYPSYNGNEDFPDDDTWEKYRSNGGKMSREDWRRDNVNIFIKRLYKSIKKEKSRVKYGMSPFGIWRPYNPPSILGLDQYNVLYADAKLWLNEGWIDYWTPQLYWPIRQIPQSYPVLLSWWVRENTHQRNLWPGLYTSRINDELGVYENINQIMVTRGFVPNGPGNVHFSMKALLENRQGIADSLVCGPYRTTSLVPPTPWLDNKPPDAPVVNARITGNNIAVSWSHKNSDDVFRWVVYAKRGDYWYYDIVNRNDRNHMIPLPETDSSESQQASPETTTESLEPPDYVAVSAVDRMGNESGKTAVKIDYTVK